MHRAAVRVQQVLTAAGVAGEVRELAESTRTAGEAAAAVGAQVGQIVKSLVFLADDRVVLALVSGANRVDVARLAAYVGQPVTQPDAATVKKRTGFSIGGVAPVGHPTPPAAYLDEDLFAHDLLWAAAGTPHAVFPITPAELIAVTDATVVTLRA